MARPATRPTALVSPKLAMPDTMVAKTSGAMIILIAAGRCRCRW